MSRTRLLLLILIAIVIALAVWIHRLNSGPPRVVFAPVERETLVSTLTTNGKVEPVDWLAVRAERPGIIDGVEAQLGQRVGKGQLLAQLDARDVRAEVSSAEAALAQAKASLQTVQQGGSAAEQVEIHNAIERDRLELKVAQRDYESLRRLAEKQAATQQDVAEASQKVQRLQADIEALERKRAALVGPAERTAAQARLEEAQSALEQARARLERSRIHAPIAGIVYDLPARPGAYLNVGDLVAGVGRLHQLRVSMYIDEPDLGRVAVGMPVTVTWDARAGRPWKCAVEKMPTQVVTLGTRHVGEAFCTIDNPDLALVPGTSVNIEITSQVVADGLTIPKEAIRSENGQVGVYVLRGNRLEWRPVRLGASSVTRAAASSGLAAGDLVALRSEAPLHNGQTVTVARE
jgi:HlyD family secretion protein